MMRVSADKVLESSIQIVSFYWTDVPELGGPRLAQYAGDDNEGVLFVLRQQDVNKVTPGRQYYWVQIQDLLDEKRGTLLKKYAVEVKVLSMITPVFQVEFVTDLQHRQKWCRGVWHPEGFDGVTIEVLADHRSVIGPQHVVPGLWSVGFRSVIQPIMELHGVVSVNPEQRIHASPRAARRFEKHHGTALGGVPESGSMRLVRRRVNFQRFSS